jgi:hypothetical protein
MDVTRIARWVHIFSAAPVLLFMLFFAVTGFFLNHGSWSIGTTKTESLNMPIPEALKELSFEADTATSALSVLHWLNATHHIYGVDIEYEWEPDELILLISLRGPSGSYEVEVYPEDNEMTVYSRSFPLLEMLNNLHRGKHTHPFWSLLSDVSAICMFLFCISGFWLFIANPLRRQVSLGWLTFGSSLMALAIYLMH